MLVRVEGPRLAGPGNATAVTGSGIGLRGALAAIVATPQDGYEIDVVALDDTLSFAGKPLVLKIDVEGYELEVLQGAKALLARNYGYVQIESFEPRRADAVVDMMARCGWHLSDRIVDDLVFRRAAV